LPLAIGLHCAPDVIDWFSKHNSVGGIQEIGEVFEPRQVATSEVYGEIKLTLDERRSIKGQNYLRLRRALFTIPYNPAL
jgi:hypothetical protein